MAKFMHKLLNLCITLILMHKFSNLSVNLYKIMNKPERIKKVFLKTVYSKNGFPGETCFVIPAPRGTLRGSNRFFTDFSKQRLISISKQRRFTLGPGILGISFLPEKLRSLRNALYVGRKKNVLGRKKIIEFLTGC